MAKHAVLFTSLLLFLTAPVIDGKASKPRVKWGQTKELLFISMLVRDLDQKTISVSIPSPGDLSFTAKSSKGDEFALEMPLREDVNGESLKWEVPSRDDKWGTVVLVTLAKKNQHRWDLLTSDAKSFKGLIDKDWSREDQKLEVEDETPYAEDGIEAGYLTELNEKNFDKTVAKYSAVIANVRYPWCTQCKSQDESFVKAAKKAKAKGKKDKAWKKVAFAVVDARENRKLDRRFGAKCDYNCEYSVLVPNDEPIKIKSKWSEDELLTEVKKYLGPAVTVVKTSDEVEAHKAENTTALGSFKSEASPAYTRYRRVASLMRGQMVFAAMFGEERPVEVWPHKQNFSFKFDGVAEDNGTELYAWIKPRAIPLIQQYDWQLRETYEGLGLPLAKLWIDDSDKNPSLEKVIRHAVRRVAKKFIGKIAFVEQKKSTYNYELRDYGLNRPEVYPAFGIASNASYNSVKYGFEVTPEMAPTTQEFWKDADKAVPVLADFCEKVLAGTWPEAHETEAPHTNWTKGSLKKLVWKTYSEIQNPEIPLLIEVFGKYRQENEKKTTEASHLAEVLASHADAFTVASYDTGDNYNPGTEFKREKYNSDTEWYWVAKDGVKQLLKPKKDAPIKTVMEFVKKQSGVDIDLDAEYAKFEQMMQDRPPVTTTLPPMPKGDMGGMGGMGGMGDMGGMGGMGGDMPDLSSLGDMGGLGGGLGGLGGKDDL